MNTFESRPVDSIPFTYDELLVVARWLHAKAEECRQISERSERRSEFHPSILVPVLLSMEGQVRQELNPAFDFNEWMIGELYPEKVRP